MTAGETIQRAHRDIQEIFRTQTADLARACEQARDRLAAVPSLDPADRDAEDDWDTLTSDLRVLLGFTSQTGVPIGKPEQFRALVLDLLWHLHTNNRSDLGAVLAQDVYHRWSAELGMRHADRVSAAEYCALCLLDIGDGNTALPLLRETVQLRTEAHGANHAVTLHATADLCRCFNNVEDYHQALRLSQDTVSVCTRVLGGDDRTTLYATTQLATSLFGLGEYEMALATYRDVHERNRRLFGTDNLSTLLAAENVAITLQKMGDHETARELNTDVLHRYERLLGKKDDRTERVRIRLSANLGALGRKDEASAVYGPGPDF
ncbi:tetratricopeptide repeat protein [Actinomadura sp. 6K520]|jgi:tetratricopeptide (TPR) repeat protein|uniref:tetratricopeptide repeat protein n=1 Tax=Actinomadura sp. 6K520 TaxID=2530364 RepID=UPI00104C3613|nr:tetratricopeptide repeat protein [Actinomadura sp. 6K520]TDE37666.1 tetratricopeptide repeat protein [Actinomadura sp. 6K520]